MPCGIKVVCEGSEEVGTGGLEAFVTAQPDVLRADTILIADAGNFAVGIPTLTTSLRGMAMVDVTLDGLGSAVHSGMFGGPAPDAIAGLVRMLASLHDDRGTPTVDGLPAASQWNGVEYPEDRYRADATVLDGVGLIGAGSIAERLWSRPALTVIGLDVPAIAGATAAVQPGAGARVSLRVPPEMDAGLAQAALADHLRRRVPWGLRCEIEPVAAADGWSAAAGGPATATMRDALATAYGREATTQGQGGSLPLVHRAGRDLSGRRDPHLRRRGAALPDPRAQRERRPGRDRADRARRSALPEPPRRALTRQNRQPIRERPLCRVSSRITLRRAPPPAPCTPSQRG